MTVPNGVHCALFILAAMIPAGLLHTAWLKSSWSGRLSVPVDFGMTFRGRRLFGPNKMLRGFVILPLASGLMFLLASQIAAPWPIPHWHYLLLGFSAGLGFMLGELPNSFIKRQLDIEAGQAPLRAPARWLFLVVDRADSTLGMLIVLQVMVPVPAMTWLILLGIGAVVHALFSITMFRLGIKARAL